MWNPHRTRVHRSALPLAKGSEQNEETGAQRNLLPKSPLMTFDREHPRRCAGLPSFTFVFVIPVAAHRQRSEADSTFLSGFVLIVTKLLQARPRLRWASCTTRSLTHLAAACVRHAGPSRLDAIANQSQHSGRAEAIHLKSKFENALSGSGQRALLLQRSSK
jgi:hypothetical protein